MKDIPGFEGQYAATKDGKIWSYPKRHELLDGGFCGHKGKFLSAQLHPDGAMYIKLYKDKKQLTRKVHRLVAQTYLPNPNNYRVINHKNAVRTDNRVQNLEWCTQKHNVLHSAKLGLLKQAKLNPEKVREMRKLAVNGVSYTEAARRYGVSKTTAAYAIRGVWWAHVK